MPKYEIFLIVLHYIQSILHYLPSLIALLFNQRLHVKSSQREENSSRQTPILAK